MKTVDDRPTDSRVRSSQDNTAVEASPGEPAPPDRFAQGTQRHGHFEAPGVQRHRKELQSLEHSFERTMRTMRMAFQPIVYAHNRALFGYEALLRSQEPDLPHPGAVFDAAEKLHRLAKLGRELRRMAAERFAAAAGAEGLLFVNLHALDLLDRSLISRYSPLSKIAPRVVLEITERSSLKEVPDVRYRVAELREMGFRIAIDDLGAGHERMNAFDPGDTDLVKLDLSLVRDIHRNDVKQQLAGSIITLCKDQGIMVIGEGVEREEEETTLYELGCDLIQGFLVARPNTNLIVPSLIER